MSLCILNLVYCQAGCLLLIDSNTIEFYAVFVRRSAFIFRLLYLREVSVVDWVDLRPVARGGGVRVRGVS